MVKRFLSYVEIMTKITSLFAFLISLAYLFYHRLQINWDLTIVFFASAFIFDLATTAINNYIDTKTNDQVLQFQRATAKFIIYLLLFISFSLGLYLAFLTDIVVLLIGGLCFICGIFYTFGPIPISRLPLGELISGVFYGLLIPFLLLYINSPSGTYLTLNINWEVISLNFNILPLVQILLLSIAPVCTTANIMLANNICDLEKDIKVKRYTLPYYLGNKSLYLFAGLYYLTYISTIIMVAIRMLPLISLFSLLTIFTVQKNINQFFKTQEKTSTFLFSIKNYVIIMGVNSILVFLGRFTV